MEANAAEDGFDIMLYPIPGPEGTGDCADPRYGVIFGTKEGREWLLYSRRCNVPTAADERALDGYIEKKAVAFRHALRTKVAELPDLLGRSYDSLLWEATARRCYSCGSCNLVCPTCYCFNIYDEVDMTLTGGERKREWDGCQLRDFAIVAGGHNFRPKAASRLRNRIFRKARWIEERSGVRGCVGCARCDRACTAKINSVEVYNQLAEEV
jgi:formate hydrogenlyase subunit 6/NADH:ubiquinone oxidoreductase subunit I